MTPEESPMVSRRTVAKGVAWSVPIIVTATAVPAYATSPGCIMEGHVYRCEATDSNWTTALSAQTITVPDGAVAMAFTVVGGGSALSLGADLRGCIPVTPGASYQLIAGASGRNGNGAQGGKSVYANGGNGGSSVAGAGGGASALRIGTTGSNYVAIAGGAGGHAINSANNEPFSNRSGSFSGTRTLNTVSRTGGGGHAGLPGSDGQAGHGVWAGTDVDVSTAVTLVGGGGGGTQSTAGAGGSYTGQTTSGGTNNRTGSAGSAGAGGNGALGPAQGALAGGGGGGGWRGGGGGGWNRLTIDLPPSVEFNLCSGGGGGSSRWSDTVTISNASAQLDPRGRYKHGFVEVTFYRCPCAQIDAH